LELLRDPFAGPRCLTYIKLLAREAAKLSIAASKRSISRIPPRIVSKFCEIGAIAIEERTTASAGLPIFFYLQP
jgi:hypothetical protein